uniref:Uncharacterized protein n=1 Tax=Rhizophagus irregularis (strain DAOM 181602 / DAOM 197198 / MUCL 43194) TaxID=747089 RepID=U9T5I6_RHIID
MKLYSVEIVPIGGLESRFTILHIKDRSQFDITGENLYGTLLIYEKKMRLNDDTIVNLTLMLEVLQGGCALKEQPIEKSILVV